MKLFGRKERDWWIVSLDNPRYRVKLGACSREHAETVLGQLQADPHVPSNLQLKKRA